MHQRAALEKGKIPDVGHRLRDAQAHQRAAVGEGTIANDGDSVWDGNFGQDFAVLKGPLCKSSIVAGDFKAQ